MPPVTAKNIIVFEDVETLFKGRAIKGQGIQNINSVPNLRVATDMETNFLVKIINVKSADASVFQSILKNDQFLFRKAYQMGFSLKNTTAMRNAPEQRQDRWLSGKSFNINVSYTLNRMEVTSTLTPTLDESNLVFRN